MGYLTTKLSERDVQDISFNRHLSYVPVFRTTYGYDGTMSRVLVVFKRHSDKKFFAMSYGCVGQKTSYEPQTAKEVSIVKVLGLRTAGSEVFDDVLGNKKEGIECLCVYE